MQLSRYKQLISMVLAIVFVGLFYNNQLGLNTLIFQSISVAFIFIIYKPRLQSVTSKILLSGTLVSSIMVVLHNSTISKVVNVISFVLLIGVLSYPKFTLFKSIVEQWFNNIKEGFRTFRKSFFHRKSVKLNVFYYLKIILVPSVLIVFFLIIYYNSNEYFAELFDVMANSVSKIFNWIPNFNFKMFLYFIVGLIISISIIYSVRKNKLMEREMRLNDTLFRKHKNTNESMMALKNEMKSGIFLLAALNFLLLIFNYSDISTFWFGYKWNGGLLKDFVHSGTYFLIISIIVSVIIVLYFFRGNINFFSKNKTIKTLTYIWLAQNFILLISLVIRNTIYINHFALAYKRIGVYAFLLATAYGIYSIFLKVKTKKSFYYLVKNNSLSIYCVFIALTCVSWDVFIAKYNVKAYKESFIETIFLLRMSDKTLPHINLDSAQIANIYKVQDEKFSFSISSRSQETYLNNFSNRKKVFMDNYPKRNFLEWNYADYKAYKLLSE